MPALIFEFLFLLFFLLFLVDVIKLVNVLLTRKKIRPAKPDHFPFLTVIIPARNEESGIERCLAGITDQTYPKESLEIIVMDDHSTDRTREITGQFQKSNQHLSLFTAEPLPEGWGGKSFANHIASQKAKGEMLLFMDADVALKPEALESVIFFMEQHQLDVVSLVAHRILVSLYEKILLPPVFFMIAAAFQQRKVQITGEFILFRRNVYEAIGGHQSVKSTVSDDLDFALLLEKANYKAVLVFAEELAATRMYASFSKLFEGISKMFQRLLSEDILIAAWRSGKYFLLTMIAVISFFLFVNNYHPVFFPKDFLLAIPALMIVVFIALTFYFRIFFLYGLLMPLGWLFQPVMFIRSLRSKYKKYHSWKGRKVYHTE